MLVAGDEMGRTQGGNNNAYCQDNEISWLDWKAADKDLLRFTQKLIHFSRSHPVFCRRRWFKGQPIKGVGLEDIAWFGPEGTEMSEEAWNMDFAKSMGVFLNGRGLRAVGTKGEPIVDDSFYIIFNAHHDALPFTLPPDRFGRAWSKVLDTAEGLISEDGGETYEAGDTVQVDGRSVVVLKEPLD